MCTDGAPETLIAPFGFNTYRWSAIDNPNEIIETQEFIVSEIGFYTLTVGHIFNQNNQVIECTTTQQFKVIASNLSLIHISEPTRPY